MGRASCQVLYITSDYVRRRFMTGTHLHITRNYMHPVHTVTHHASALTGARRIDVQAEAKYNDEKIVIHLDF